MVAQPSGAFYVRRYEFTANLSKMYERLIPDILAVSYTHLRAHETVLDIVCRLLLEKKNKINLSKTGAFCVVVNRIAKC